jgi:putative flippase GtrA
MVPQATTFKALSQARRTAGAHANLPRRWHRARPVWHNAATMRLPRHQELLRIIRFGLTGCFNTGVDWLAFWLLARAAGLPPGTAQALAYLAGTANSWFLNSLWVFRPPRADRKAAAAASPVAPGARPGPAPRPPLLRFLAVNLASTALTALAMHALDNLAILELWQAKALVTALGMGMNYLLYRWWVFRTGAGS